MDFGDSFDLKIKYRYLHKLIYYSGLYGSWNSLVEISHRDTNCALHLHLGKPISARISHIHAVWIQAKKPLQPAILGCSTKLFQEPQFSPLSPLSSFVTKDRKYKIFRIDAESGKVLSMKIRTLEPA